VTLKVTNIGSDRDQLYKIAEEARRTNSIVSTQNVKSVMNLNALHLARPAMPAGYVSYPQAIVARCAMILTTAAVILSLCACSKAPTRIDATPPSVLSRGTGTATLSWVPPRRNVDGSAVSNLAGYYIYYGTSPTNLNGVIKLPDPYTTKYTVDGLSPGTYYFSIVAFTTTGIRSSASPTVSKTIP